LEDVIVICSIVSRRCLAQGVKEGCYRHGPFVSLRDLFLTANAQISHLLLFPPSPAFPFPLGLPVEAFVFLLIPETELILTH
jgi:hypothetical protein